jgi:catechol 2,3-dioxygenase-like lactoylglutathione lyase family enzyme
MVRARMRHIGVGVRDLEKMVAFYRDYLGFEVVRRMEESGPFLDGLQALKDVKVTTVKMAPPGDTVQIEFLKFHVHASDNAPPSVNDNGVTHIALTVDDVDAIYGQLTALGLKFNAAPAVSPDGKAKVTFGRDPEGNLLELVQVL